MGFGHCSDDGFLPCKLSSLACRRDAPPGFRAAPRADFAVTAIRLQSLTPSRQVALRASLASRGSAQGPSPPRAAWHPSNTTEPALPDRSGLPPAGEGQGGAGGYAMACCTRLCACVPSSTLPVLAHHVTKDGSRTRRTASPWRFHTTPQDWRRRVRRGCSRLSSGCLTWPASASMPVQTSCGDVESASLLSEWFGPRRPCLVVNPGGGAAAPRASWLQPSGENNFPCFVTAFGAFLAGQILCASRLSTALRPHAV